MTINLLPWRDILKMRVIKCCVLLLFFILLLCTLVVYYIYTSASARIFEQSVQSQQLKEDFIKLQNDYKLQFNKEKKVNESIDNISITYHAPVIQEEFFKINYAKVEDLALLIKDKSNSLLSAVGVVMADKRTNTLWVEDNVEHVQRIKKFLRLLDVPKQQVLIEARLVNIANDTAEDLGVRFGFLQAHNAVESGLDGGNPTVNSRRFNYDFGATPLDSSPATLGLALLGLGKNALLDLELSALQSEGRAQIIASPRLITANQEPAVIESGEDIPYQEHTASGATSVSFKKAVLSLRVVPHITFDNKLLMSLSIVQDSDSGRRVQGVPIIATKSIETKVMVDDGQTIVLGGIYKRNKNSSMLKVPILGELPAIGKLFSKTQVTFRNEELLIFITPKIVAWSGLMKKA